MATIPLWAIGKHVTSVLLTPQTVNTTTGALSDTTPTREFFGHLQEIELTTGFTFENISAMDRPYENNVPVEQATGIRITELEKSAGTNLAAAAAFGATYWKYVLTRGAQSFTSYGVIGEYKTMGTKPKVTASLELRNIDVGTAFPTYS